MAYEDPRRPGDPTPVRRGGWGAGWWIMFFVVIAFIIWAVAWSWNGRGTRAAVTPALPAGAIAAATGETATAPHVSVAELQQPNPWINQNVQVNDVKMASSAGKQAFWVTGADGNRLLVIQNQNAMPESGQATTGTAANQQFHQGELLNITGRVQKVNSPNELQQQYDLQKQAASELKAGQAYLLAQQINPQNNNLQSNQNQNP